ncbi:cation:proton antiporter [Phenylobacterium montanum]|uniref:Cation:proton antiporter n=1 Tax=Phenylobacterium montanum TaxID=2823693 RepID=A0A975FZ53_9CAUL|nr:cation:proton antiporter [Caulobacter sp. S6]QUD86996.1 cation:proton antiporter [Caulobacter sp. S6]
MSLSLFDLAAIFLSLAAAIGWLNLKLVRLPAGVAMLVVGLVGTLALVGIDRIAPGLGVGAVIEQVVRQVDFSAAVLQFMLAYLLFAGAMHVDFEALRRRGWTAAVLATLGVVVSAAVVGGGFWLIGGWGGIRLSFAWALVFGVLISPTDPVGVLAALKRTSLVPDIRALIEGEALFNDGVGVVLFGAAVALATGGGAATPLSLAGRVLVEAGGGGALGLLAGLVAIRAMRAIDDYAVEVGITLALSTGTYALSQALGLSGPIAVVVAGLMLGRHSARETMSAETRRYTRAFWTIVDENLNGLLFLLLGLEVFGLRYDRQTDSLAAAAIPLVFLARWASLAGPAALLAAVDGGVKPGLVAVLTWAGVRGGLSVAMALSLAPSPERAIILAATYVVVVFSVIFQSLTLERIIVRLGYGRPLESS